MFGAHRAFVYGSSAAAKTTLFASDAKGHVRESHAKDYIHKHVQPKIQAEELLDYHKVLDDMAFDPC